MNAVRIFLLCLFTYHTFAQEHDYKVINTFHIGSAGGWDYLALNNGKLYVSHGTQVNILNPETGDSLGVIRNTKGVHGIAFDNELGKGYTSNGAANNVSVFDLATDSLLNIIPTGNNPDAIMLESYTKMIITNNGSSKNLSIIDPVRSKVIKTIDVGGKPETAVSDGAGKLFVNIEDKNEVVEIDLNNYAVKYHWPLNGGEGPSGLAYDPSNKRLFVACDGKLVVMNAETGKIITNLPIGSGCDGVVFDKTNNTIVTSNGSGTITVIKENGKDNYSVAGNYPTKRGARTITLDPDTGVLYLPTADFESNTPAGQRPKMIPGTFVVLKVK